MKIQILKTIFVQILVLACIKAYTPLNKIDITSPLESQNIPYLNNMGKTGTTQKGFIKQITTYGNSSKNKNYALSFHDYSSSKDQDHLVYQFFDFSQKLVGEHQYYPGEGFKLSDGAFILDIEREDQVFIYWAEQDTANSDTSLVKGAILKNDGNLVGDIVEIFEKNSYADDNFNLSNVRAGYSKNEKMIYIVSDTKINDKQQLTYNYIDISSNDLNIKIESKKDREFGPKFNKDNVPSVSITSNISDSYALIIFFNPIDKKWQYQQVKEGKLFGEISNISDDIIDSNDSNYKIKDIQISNVSGQNKVSIIYTAQTKQKQVYILTLNTETLEEVCHKSLELKDEEEVSFEFYEYSQIIPISQQKGYLLLSKGNIEKGSLGINIFEINQQKCQIIEQNEGQQQYIYITEKQLGYGYGALIMDPTSAESKMVFNLKSNNSNIYRNRKLTLSIGNSFESAIKYCESYNLSGTCGQCDTDLRGGETCECVHGENSNMECLINDCENEDCAACETLDTSFCYKIIEEKTGFLIIDGNIEQCSSECGSCETTQNNCLICSKDYKFDNSNQCIKSNKNEDDDNNTFIIIIICVASIVTIFAIGGIITYQYHKKTKKQEKQQPSQHQKDKSKIYEIDQQNIKSQ